VRTSDEISATGVVQVDPAVTARYRSTRWWREQTYLDDFRAAACRAPDRAAIVGHRAGRARPDTLTYRRLAGLVDRFAGGLLQLGVRRADIVAVQLPNRWEFAALTLACARIGAVIAPIMPIFREREVRHILQRTRSAVCVVPDRFRGFSHAGMLASLRPSLPDLEHVLVLDAGEELPAGLRSFDDHFVRQHWEDRHRPAELDALRPAGHELAQLMFTSGTTGEPKGVMHTFDTVWTAARAPADRLGLGAGEVVLMASPVTHQLGFLYGVILPLCLGMKLIYQDTWDAPTMLALVEQEQVSFTMAATPFVIDAVRAQRAERRRLDSLRYFLSGGAPIPSELVRQARAELGAQLVAVWGMTENGVVTMTGPDDPDELVAASDGQPVPSMRIRVVHDDGTPAAPGEVGRLQVTGAAQTVGYFQRPDLYQASLVDREWFDTGDLARLRADGGIRIAGRLKDLIIRGGENIPVTEVESALYQHPMVAEVAVVGYPDPRLGERVCAVIVPDGQAPTVDDLTAHLARLGMTRTYWPERLEVVDQLPKTASGKVQKFILRERLAPPTAAQDRTSAASAPRH
jgi:cyclohexanecarboxylate-CoA ligase